MVMVCGQTYDGITAQRVISHDYGVQVEDSRTWELCLRQCLGRHLAVLAALILLLHPHGGGWDREKDPVISMVRYIHNPSGFFFDPQAVIRNRQPKGKSKGISSPPKPTER